MKEITNVCILQVTTISKMEDSEDYALVPNEQIEDVFREAFICDDVKVLKNKVFEMEIEEK